MAELPTTVFVLYGATGDLAARMVLPAFHELAERQMLPDQWLLVGSGRGQLSDDDFREHVKDVVAESPDWEAFADRLRFAGGGFTVDDPGALLDVLGAVRGDLGGDALLVHYLAVPPTTFEDYTRAISAHSLAEGARVVYEKPYGTSPAGFRELDDLVHDAFDESQVFRIDHFLGKEATQNLHVVRFANDLFADVWSREHVVRVVIDVPETLDVDDRATFYDATGALLDMIVTHLMQVAAEVAMEPPVSLSATDLQNARESVIAAFRPLSPDEVVLGQFEGYRAVEGVAEDSDTDTYVAARMWVDTDRWHGVPFLLRTGKRLGAAGQLVSLVLRPTSGPVAHAPQQGNVLTFSMEGSGALSVRLVAKQPGPDLSLGLGTATLELDDVPGGEALSAYAALLHDVLVGDRSLFTSREGMANAWRVVEPIMSAGPAVVPYAAGSMGPEQADRLLSAGSWPVTGPGS